jgi:hypothetical protein
VIVSDRPARSDEEVEAMKYMLLIYGDEQAAAQATPEQTQQVSDAYEQFTQSIIASGQFVDGDPFMPTSTAKSVRVTDGGTQTTDGPTVSTTPQLIAYYKVQADSPQQAAELAARVPGARWGSIEVRPVVQFD